MFKRRRLIKRKKKRNKCIIEFGDAEIIKHPRGSYARIHSRISKGNRKMKVYIPPYYIHSIHAHLTLPDALPVICMATAGRSGVTLRRQNDGKIVRHAQGNLLTERQQFGRYPALVILFIERSEYRFYEQAVANSTVPHLLFTLPPAWKRWGAPMVRQCIISCMRGIEREIPQLQTIVQIDDDLKCIDFRIKNQKGVVTLGDTIHSLQEFMTLNNAAIVSPSSARRARAAEYKSKEWGQVVQTTRCEKIVLLDLNQVQRHNYILKKYWNLTDQEWQSITRKAKKDSAIQKRYRQGEDFGLCKELKADGATVIMIPHLIIQELVIPTINYTVAA